MGTTSASTVFITGGAGFIGRVTARRLYELGHKPIIFDTAPLENRPSGNDLGVQIVGDICDKRSLFEAMSAHRPMAVIHLAALTSVVESNKNPKKYHKTNVFGGLNVLEAMSGAGCTRILFASSAAIFKQSDKKISENYTKRPLSVYGETKKFFENELFQWQKRCGYHYVVLRYFNVSGAPQDGLAGEGRSAESKLIPRMVSVLRKRRAFLPLFGNSYDTHDGTAIRDYVHVDDVAEANTLALRVLLERDGGRSYNIGSGSGTSNLEVVRAFEKISGIKVPIRYYRPRSTESVVVVADPRRAIKELNWAPAHSSIENILRTSLRWYQAGR